MTNVRRWLLHRRRLLVTRHLTGGVLGVVGLALLTMSGGLGLARAGLYHRVPLTVLLAWFAVLVAIGAGVGMMARRLRTLALPLIARLVERGGRTRAGWVEGVAALDGASDHGLASLADRQVMAWLDEAGDHALRGPARRANRSVVEGAAVLAVGAVVLFAAGPASPLGNDFWRPLAVVRRAASPVTLTADRTHVNRGDSVRLRVSAPGRGRADLLLRAPGETWEQRSLELDTAGMASVTLGPLLSDRFLRAVSGDRSSETLHLRVTLPLLLTDLEVRVRFPGYTERPDEFVSVGADTLWLPYGTEVRVRGRASVPLRDIALVSPTDTAALAVDADAFAGTLSVAGAGRWTLEAHAVEGGARLIDAPAFVVVAVRDSVPVVTVPLPGADTTAPLTLRQGLLIDVRDDYRVRQLELESWRVTRRGEVGEPVVEPLPVPEGGAQRTLLSWVLDLNDRGFLPGDTAFYRVRAHDNAPRPNVGQSRTYALRLPSMSELRRSMREASRAAQRGADSLAATQQELARRMEDLAAERQRSVNREGLADAQLPYDAVERARELIEDQGEVTQRTEELQRELRDLSEAAWNAGLTDPAFHEQLRELQDLLSRAISDELMESLTALQQALDRLSPAGVEDALQRLAEAADRLREQLEQGRELFQRAAVEGELTTLAAEAEDLARRETEWSASVEQRDSSQAAREEQALAQQTDELQGDMEAVAGLVDSLGMSTAPLAAAGVSAAEAEALMERAAAQAQAAQASAARRSGEQATAALQRTGEALEGARDGMRESWRAEVLAEMDRALVEVADLARREEQLGERLRRGETGPEVRGQQGAVREGVERVAQRLKAAAGKNALVPQQLGASLGLAQRQMDDALESVQRAQPSPADAAASAGAAVDALNAAAYAIVRSRDDVAGSGSGSGFSEAMERMAQAAKEQGAMNGEAGGLFPMMQAGGGQLRQRLRELAARQEALAQELERIRAESDLSGAGALAEEAARLAAELEGGRLDQDVLDRQEQLFRRLLDAGRSLESEQLDERRERVSETARPGEMRHPVPAVQPGRLRYPYPTWDELRGLSPDERRLIVEYFRRLNDAGR